MLRSTLWILPLLAGCGRKQPPPESTWGPPPALTTADGHDRTQAMQFHQSRAAYVLDSLVAADLQAAQEQLAWMAAHPPPAEDLDPAAVARIAALAGTPAPDLAAASATLGEIAAECGACHALVVGGPKPVASVQTRLGNETPHGPRSQRALELLWQGLVGPDEASWQEGRALLTLGGMLAIDAPADQYPPASPSTLRAALEGTEPAERGRAFGALVGACATCHQGHPGAVARPEPLLDAPTAETR
ncbi:hypothetical protein L6R53_20345 [Myxococcota bacterium]|nr:hypothetical protein [Myxococcota bacterium]